MRVNKKLLKHLIKKPRIRPRIIRSLTQFDENINREQDAKLTADRQNSDTLNLLRFLINRMDPNHDFKLPKRTVVDHFMFNKPSLNFNFAALHQLKLIKVDWTDFKSTSNVKGHVNTRTVF